MGQERWRPGRPPFISTELHMLLGWDDVTKQIHNHIIMKYLTVISVFRLYRQINYTPNESVGGCRDTVTITVQTHVRKLNTINCEKTAM